MLFTIRISGITTIFERKNYKLLIYNQLKNRFYKLFFFFLQFLSHADIAEMAEIFPLFPKFLREKHYLCEKYFDMIRTLKYLGIVVLLALVACNSHEKEYDKADAVLQEAERLYQHPQGERADYPGADTVQISQELADAAEFFVKRNDFGKAAVASFYCGYAQKEDDDKILATKYFKDA